MELAPLSLIANGASFDYCKFFAKYDQRRANVEHTRAIRRRLKLFNYDRHKMTKKKKGENEWKVRNVAKDIAEGRRQRSRRPTIRILFYLTRRRPRTRISLRNSFFLRSAFGPSSVRCLCLTRRLPRWRSSMTLLNTLKWLKFCKFCTSHCISMYRRANEFLTFYWKDDI